MLLPPHPIMADKWAKGCRGWYEPIPVKHHVNGCQNLLSAVLSFGTSWNQRIGYSEPFILSASAFLHWFVCFVVSCGRKIKPSSNGCQQVTTSYKLVQKTRWILSTFPRYPSLGPSQVGAFAERRILSFCFFIHSSWFGRKLWRKLPPMLQHVSHTVTVVFGSLYSRIRKLPFVNLYSEANAQK